jgi:CO dehydrogenase nickel-insertion accessory protein CooC1
MKTMIRLKPVETKKKRVCPVCYAKGEVKTDCKKCYGKGVISSTTIRYTVATRPVEIEKIDRDPDTGIIRYWGNKSEFFYETTTHELNKYVPEIPFGIHLLHDNFDEALIEAERVNKALEEIEIKANKGFIENKHNTPWYVQTQEEPKKEEIELYTTLKPLLTDPRLDYVHELYKLKFCK